VSLRDALLSAGLVDEKKKKKAEREAAARDRQRSRDTRRKPKTAAAVPTVVPRTPEERAAAAARVGEVVASNRRVPRRGPRRWYYALRDGRVGWLELDGTTVRDLERGDAALVEHDGDAILVDGAAAKGLLALDADAVRCLNGR